MNHVSNISNLGWIISRFYAEEHFSDKAKEVGETIVTYVRQQYAKTIKSLDWIDDSVKAVALEKLDKLIPQIGFPEKVRRRSLSFSLSSSSSHLQNMYVASLIMIPP